MQHRSVLTAVTGLGFVVLAACTQTVEDSRVDGASTSPPAITGSLPVTSSSGTTPVDDTRGPASSSVLALNSDTESWFIVYCEGITDLAQYTGIDVAGRAFAELQAGAEATFADIAISAETTVGILQMTPPPAISGGSQLAQVAIDRFTALSNVYKNGAQSVAAVPANNRDGLESAIAAVTRTATVLPNTMADVDPAVLAAAKELPECQNVLN